MMQSYARDSFISFSCLLLWEIEKSFQSFSQKKKSIIFKETVTLNPKSELES